MPLNIGRRFKINKLQINATAGLSYTITHIFSGRTKRSKFIIDDETYSLTSRIGFQAGVGWEYPIRHNSSLFLNANIRKAPSLRFGEGFEKNHLSYTLGAGVRVYFRQKNSF